MDINIKNPTAINEALNIKNPTAINEALNIRSPSVVNDVVNDVVNENKRYIMRYSMILILISLIISLINVIDYYEGWTSNNHQFYTALYGIDWFVLALTIMYFINTRQRSTLVAKFINLKKEH